MKRKLAAFLVAGALAGGVVATNLSTASATDPTIARLQRQVRILKAQVVELKHSVADLNYGVYTCEFIDTSTPTSFSDGTIGYPLYEDSTC
jgi:hypothetical protein